LPEVVVQETVADGIPDGAPQADQSDEDGGPLPACDPGEGCFLDECKQNPDCQSGWCVEHMGQKVCTITCQEECPPGWTCSQVGSSEPDVVFICVSNFANLCLPCNEGADCVGVAGTEDACVSYGAEGSFCGGKCGQGGGCPWGFSCKKAATVDGIEIEQCVADTGLCPCTGTAVELGLFTGCEVGNGFGTCKGKRVCTEQGLSECDAPEPAKEICNGADDDCNGLTDEVDQVKGTPVCDDGNACTDDECKGEGGCVHAALEEGECLDGDACTIGDHCEGGVCVGQPIVCDDGDVCTDDLCDGLGGCAAGYNAADCDDVDPCTVNDTCEQGACIGYAVDCECSVDSDCLALEDDSVCNGTLFCDTSKLPYLCQVEQGTVVVCPAPDAGPDAICLKPVCDAETGECSLVPDHEGFACEDGDHCSIGDKCVAGACKPGVAQNCNDGNGCTDDACEPSAGCVHSDNTAPCEDGDLCSAGDACSAGQCQGGLPLECDDGDLCNGQETCASGVGCKTGAPLKCDDSDPCNGVEKCDPLVGCKAGMPLACDDGDFCNGLETCASGIGCKTGKPAVCQDDGDVCTDSFCDANVGCMTVLNDALCDDGDVCTTGDHCEMGACVSSGALTCDDDNECTDDWCDEAAGCKFAHNKAGCDDGVACTTGDTCKNGACSPGVPVECDDGKFCNGKETCDLALGCVAGATPILDDGVECTLDACDETTDDVIHSPVDVLCDDDEFCNGEETCDAILGCASGNAPSLDDGVSCTLDSCDEGADEAIHVAQDADCDDGKFCNGEETCDAVLDCLPGAPPPLDDGEPCTADTCDEGADTVVHTPIVAKQYFFGTCGKTGFTGPSQGQCDGAYSGTSLQGLVTVNAGVQFWTVPQTGAYDIEAVGAGGGLGKDHSTDYYSNGVPGKGARMSGKFVLNKGDGIRVVVGQRGSEALGYWQKGGGGGGGSFVVKSDGTPLLVAGGGGGAGRYNGMNGGDGVTGQNGTAGGGTGGAGGTNGGGGAVTNCGYGGNSGAGFTGNGVSACSNSYYAKSFNSGGEGSDWSHCWNEGNAGGFGGGGGTGPHGGAGGGGYSGGGGGGDHNCGSSGGGGGGGSFNAGQNQVNQAGFQSGHGSVTIGISCN